MEDVLEVYHREFDEDTVLVCMDETSKQQTKETRTPQLPARKPAARYQTTTNPPPRKQPPRKSASSETACLEKKPTEPYRINPCPLKPSCRVLCLRTPDA